jgi:hypothetical protein
MRHALVEILDIGINTGISLTDYAAPHRRRRLLEGRSPVNSGFFLRRHFFNHYPFHSGRRRW